MLLWSQFSVAGFFLKGLAKPFFLKGLAKPCFVHFLRFSQGKPYFPCILDGLRAIFLRFSLRKRTFRWVLLGKTLIFLAYWTVFVIFSSGFR